MAVVFETRPVNLGDQVMVRGTYAASDTTIDLSPYMRIVDSVQIMLPTGTATPVTSIGCDDGGGGSTNKNVPTPDGCYITGTGGTSVTLFGGVASSAGATAAGHFIAIGRKG